MSSSSWKSLTPDNHQRIPIELHNWLIDTGSLTAKLRKLCNSFSVHLISQINRSSLAHESTLLELEKADAVIDRQVQLYCDETPVVYARSLIPVKAVSDRFNDLDSMGENPLGEKIFSDPQLSRSPIEWTQLKPDHPLFQSAMENIPSSDIPDSIYGRRSLFYGAAKPIMISEFFLPKIKDLTSE